MKGGKAFDVRIFAGTTSALVSKNAEKDKMTKAPQSPQPARMFLNSFFFFFNFVKSCQTPFLIPLLRGFGGIAPCSGTPPGYEILLRQT